jgi:hypothetical protein
LPAIRLSEQERRQVADAATRLGNSLSGFVREAAPQASAWVTGKVGELEDDEPASVYTERGLVALEPVRHMVDGEWTGRYLA